MAHTHRLEAVRAHLLEQAGDTTAARNSYLRAAKMTASLPEQRYLELRAARLPNPPHDGLGGSVSGPVPWVLWLVSGAESGRGRRPR